jgi:gliding motility-associated lipoprotein GldB
MNRFPAIFLFISLVFVSCNSESKLEKTISDIDIDLVVERFDQAFTNASIDDLPNLKATYPFMFSKRFHDSIWVNRMKDTLQIALSNEVEKAHGNLGQTELEIESLFQHLKYYYKEFKTPRVITVAEYVDYRSKTIVTDSIVLISLTNYLGADHEYYQNIHQYVAENLKPDQIIPDLADNYARKNVYQSRRKTLLDEMIYSGKVLYFKDMMLPNMSDERKMGYTTDELEWAKSNEESIWQYFIERELLFSTDNKLPGRFINPAPFTKFNLELDSESPGRLGQYLGWQIVRAYTNNNEASLQDILSLDAETLFNNSKFKPRK